MTNGKRNLEKKGKKEGKRGGEGVCSKEKPQIEGVDKGEEVNRRPVVEKSYDEKAQDGAILEKERGWAGAARQAAGADAHGGG